MDKPEAMVLFNTEIKGRWPKFEPSGTLLSDWLDLLCRHKEADIKQASKQYFYEYKIYGDPELHKFKGLLGQGRYTVKHDPKYQEEPIYFIQCIENGANCKQGTFHPMRFSDDNFSPDTKLRLTCQSADKHVELYGGQWTACENTHGEMVKWRVETFWANHEPLAKEDKEETLMSKLGVQLSDPEIEEHIRRTRKARYEKQIAEAQEKLENLNRSMK